MAPTTAPAAPATAVAAPPEPATTRERILATATELFIELGYEATSLREISERLGFTKAALYYHFKSKEEILRSIMEPINEIQRDLIDRIEAARSLEEWASVLAWTIDQFFDNRQLFDLMQRNRSAVATLAESSDFFEDHERLHAQVEAALARPELPLAQRIRIVCAFGSVVTFDDFGGLLLEEPQDVLRAELVKISREILGLGPNAPEGGA